MDKPSLKQASGTSSVFTINLPRLLKTIFVLGCVTTLLVALLVPKYEGYGDIVAIPFLVFLSSFLFVYSFHAYDVGEVEIQQFTVKQKESPNLYWCMLILYFISSITFLVVMFWHAYT